MSIIHRTTMKPTKLELLTPWLPAQPWYTGTADAPVLSRTGGFRLDDPEGAVGIEFMVVTDESGAHPVSYHVPLSYRAERLDGVEESALVGTSEHGVLGLRWIYDGTHDPVVVAGLLALLQGRGEPQMQSVSDTPDPSVAFAFTGGAVASGVESTTVTHGKDGTRLAITTSTGGPVTVDVTRLLGAAVTTDALGHVTAGWHAPDGTDHRDVFAVLRGATA
ncbi:hypothetical protein OK074_0268 [Actinobacteria bacterium OK074]|nr:hypothetical protein OK074_0268 [Actinobacteria bacterium OK074]